MKYVAKQKQRKESANTASPQMGLFVMADSQGNKMAESWAKRKDNNPNQATQVVIQLAPLLKKGAAVSTKEMASRVNKATPARTRTPGRKADLAAIPPNWRKKGAKAAMAIKKAMPRRRKKAFLRIVTML